MSMKVARGGLAVVAVLGTATLLSTSILPAASLPATSRNLNLSLASRTPAAQLPGTLETGAMAWEIHGSPGAALRAAHASGTDDPGNSPNIDTSSSRLIIVSLEIDTTTRTRVLTNAVTVGALVEALGLDRKGQVSVHPSARTPLRQHAVVRVSMIRTSREVVIEPVPFKTLIQYSRDLGPGDVRVLQAGRTGTARRIYLVTVRNGRTSRRLLHQRILVPPVPQIEARGFIGSGVQYGQATWYGCDGMHAAHRTLPFGTVVTVTNLDTGATVTVTINDRGPYADGRIIDLCDQAFAQIAPLGQGVANVKITW